MALVALKEPKQEVLFIFRQFEVAMPGILLGILEVSLVGCSKAVREGIEVRGFDKACLEGSLGNSVADGLDPERRVSEVRGHHGRHIVHWTRILE